MNFRFFYAAAIFFLLVMYAVFLEPGGFRLPRYYTPDGLIVPVGDVTPDWFAIRFLEIGGKETLEAPAVFQTSDPVQVRTEGGIGIMRVIPNNLWRVIVDFKFVIFFSFVFLLCSLWFLESGNDIYLSAFSFLMALFFFSAVISLGAHGLHFLWQFTAFALIPAMLNMALRTTGKEISGYLLLLEVILVMFFSLIAYVGSAYTFFTLRVGTAAAYFMMLAVVIGIQLDNALRASDDPVERGKRWALVAGSVLGLAVPSVALSLLPYWHKSGDPLLMVFLPGLLFPISLLYGTYRLQLVPYQFIITRSILAGALTIFLVGVYSIALLAHTILLPERDRTDQWIVNVFFILTLVFFLDPARRKLAAFLDTRLLRLSAELSESLKRMGVFLSSPLKIQSTASSFMSEIRETLGVDRVALLFEQGAFPGLHIRPPPVTLSGKSPLWKFFESEKIIITSYLTYGGGIRAELYKFLVKNDIFLALGIAGERKGWLQGFLPGRFASERPPPSIRAALLVGYRTDKRRFRLSEIRYLQEAARLAGLLVYNYTVLIQEVQKRRRMRELFLAGQLQRHLLARDDSEATGLKMAYFNLPVISVTGDYLDIIPLGRKRTAVFLGDVTGHGLGTGYLVSAIRAIVHSHLFAGAGLVETMQTLNNFLMNRYQGNEFATVFACIINSDTGKMEYVNAAHPGPFIKTPGDSELLRVKDTQRLLGVLATPFHSVEITLKPNQRVFLFSDGVTETFNEKDEPFGDVLLHNFIAAHGDEEPEKITAALREVLEKFRGEKRPSDDTTFLVFECVPKPQPLRTLFSIFGVETR